MIQDRHIDVWKNCLSIIENIIEPQQFKTWFSTITPVSLVESTLTVSVPSDFVRDYLESAFLNVIKSTLRRVIGADARLIYEIRTVSNQPRMSVPGAQATTPVNRTVSVSSFQPSGNPGPFVYPGIKKLQINPRLNPNYCFANLVQGQCNKLGISAGQSIANAPGKNPFNPLFIFGGSGVGKTHLAQAIGIAIKEADPEPVVLYITGNEFKTQYMEAIQKNKLTEFLSFYMKIDVLIVDDIQDLQGKSSQNAFFNVFNHLHQNFKQLIFTSDRSPAQLQNFEERLLSRFRWGLPVELQRPDYNTRLEMLRSRAFREGIDIKEPVLEYLASHIKSNFRELEGAMMSLLAHATLLHQDITIDLAATVTDRIVDNSADELTIEKVQSVVCEYFGITIEDMLANTRKRNIVQARQIAMFMCRNLIASCSLATIGQQIGGKDHATVLHACNTVSDLVATDKSFRKYVSDIQGILAPSDNQ